MAVHNFTFTPPRSTVPTSASFVEQKQDISIRPERVKDFSDKPKVVDDAEINYAPEYVSETVTKGFYVLDEGMKNWLSGIKVQVKDIYKIASVHFVAQDRSILAWAQDFFNGRVSLPVISLKRNSWKFNPTWFRPPYMPMARQFTDRSGKRVRLTYMPIPFEVDYAVSIWAEYRHDAEFIQTNIVKRCSPMGEMILQDEYLQQFARITLGGVNDSSDVDIDAKARPKVLYDLSLTVEYAIPINEKIVPTILGKVVSIKEQDSYEVFDVYRIGDIS